MLEIPYPSRSPRHERAECEHEWKVQAANEMEGLQELQNNLGMALNAVTDKQDWPTIEHCASWSNSSMWWGRLRCGTWRWFDKEQQKRRCKSIVLVWQECSHYSTLQRNTHCNILHLRRAQHELCPFCVRVCVLLCFIKPILGNHHGPGVSSRASQGGHTHDPRSLISLLTLCPLAEPGVSGSSPCTLTTSVVILIPSSYSSKGPTTATLTTKGMRPGGSIVRVWAGPKFVWHHRWVAFLAKSGKQWALQL